MHAAPEGMGGGRQGGLRGTSAWEAGAGEGKMEGRWGGCDGMDAGDAGDAGGRKRPVLADKRRVGRRQRVLYDFNLPTVSGSWGVDFDNFLPTTHPIFPSILLFTHLNPRARSLARSRFLSCSLLIAISRARSLLARTHTLSLSFSIPESMCT